MAHAMYEVWEDPIGDDDKSPWCAQMVNYAPRFPTRKAAEDYAATIRRNREKAGLK